MVNHFATLLGNLNIAEIAETLDTYVLADELDFDITTEDDELVCLSLYPYDESAQKNYTPLVNRHMGQITLPFELQRFYDLIFPPGASDYFKQFLLYTYLRIVDATDYSDSVKLYDSRISYDLDSISDYFRFPRVSITATSDPSYRLLVTGGFKVKEDVEYFTNDFIISQVGSTSDILIYCPTQKKFHKQGKPASSLATGMATTLQLSTSNNTISKNIVIGETGLKFAITGPFTADAPRGFLTTGNRSWSFSAEAPFEFDFHGKIKELEANYNIVDDMLSSGEAFCDPKYSNIWRIHYNDTYRLAGLLQAYVERVNLVWQKRLT